MAKKWQINFVGKRMHYAAEHHTLSVMYPLCGVALTDTKDNQSEMCPTKLADFCLFCTIVHTQSYRGRIFPQDFHKL